LGAVAFGFYYYDNNAGFHIEWEYLNAVRWSEEVGLGLLGFAALALLTRGSQLDAPARTAICLYLEIPFVYIGQCVMTQSFPDIYVFVGIFLVLCSVIIPAVRKLRRANQQRKILNAKTRHRPNHKERRKYSEDSNYSETMPLIGRPNGVTVDWSTEEESDIDIDS